MAQRRCGGDATIIIAPQLETPGLSGGLERSEGPDTKPAAYPQRRSRCRLQPVVDRKLILESDVIIRICTCQQSL
jgi:hypothetical protein